MGGDTDKLAAYQTLYDVLVTLTKVLAPVIPFLSERMYRNLVSGQTSMTGATECSTDTPQSVHLCDFPQPNADLLSEDLNQSMAIAQRFVKLGHRLREEAGFRVRQPLSSPQYSSDDEDDRIAIHRHHILIAEELNVQPPELKDNLDDLVSYSFKPNLKTLGPKYGKLLGAIRKELPEMDPAALAPLQNGETVTVTIGGREIVLQPDDVLVTTEQAADWVVAGDRGIQIALSTKLTPELLAEGMRNDFIRHVQQARKDANLEIQDRIRVFYHTDDAACRPAIEQWTDYIQAETLADAVTFSDEPPGDAKPVTVGDAKVYVWIEKV